MKTAGVLHLDSYIKNDTQKLISTALTSVKKNENNYHYYQTILMHDDKNKPISIQSLPKLIEKMISQGYHFEKLTSSSHIIKHVK